MARLLLSRSTPITLAEAERLPAGARVDNGAHGGRVSLALPDRDLDAMLQAAAALGRAVPDARLDAHDLPDLTAPAPAAAPPAESSPAPAAPLPATPWELLEDGETEAALAAFAVEGLDAEGRDRVRRQVDSTDPAEVALACRIAQAAEWRSFVTQMRRLLQHGDVVVRTQAVRAIGQMAGPSMSWQLERLSADPSPDVREAVVAALAEIEARQG